MHARTHARTHAHTHTLTLYSKAAHLNGLDESKDTDGPEAAECGKDGEDEVVSRWDTDNTSLLQYNRLLLHHNRRLLYHNRYLHIQGNGATHEVLHLEMSQPCRGRGL